MPSIWYEIGLSGPGMEVSGAGLPGTPGVLIGHNEHISWGITASCIDTQDLVIEQINPDNSGQYLYEGTWRDGTMVRERIEVRGKSFPVVENVLVTHHGPLLTSAGDAGGRAMALRWTALEPGTVAEAALAINRARSWEEFVSALRLWTSPPMCFVFAHTGGDIGMYAAGAVPIRSKGDGTLPVPGWTGEYEWSGLVPFDALPQAHNPSTHLIVAANNRLVGNSYPYPLGNDWLPGYRARRITDTLEGRTDLSVEDFRQIQLDLFSQSGQEAAALLASIKPVTDIERTVLAKVAEWDGFLDAGSVGGCIALAFQHHLLRAVFEPVLGDITETYLGTGTSPSSPRNGFFSRPVPFVYDLARRRDDGWFQRLGVRNASWEAVIRRALSDTITFLTDRLGPEVAGWQWGRLNQLGFEHVLGARLPLARWLNRGPAGMGGDDNTVAAACLPLHSPFDTNGWGASYRQIVDMGDLPRSISMHATGQSGNVASEHYDDMLPAWREGRYHPLSLPVGDARRELGGHLVLEPEQRA
jgi:penicillin amidase